MKMIGLARLGRDVEVRYTPNGDPVANLSLAYDYGQKVDGKRPTQWIDATLWGKRAESLAPYLTKAALIMVEVEDVHTEEYESKGSTKTKLVGRVVDVQFTGRKNDAEAPAPRAPARPTRQAATAFDDMANDPPF